MGRCVTKAFVFTTTPLRGHIRPPPDTGESDYAPESRPFFGGAIWEWVAV